MDLRWRLDFGLEGLRRLLWWLVDLVDSGIVDSG